MAGIFQAEGREFESSPALTRSLPGGVLDGKVGDELDQHGALVLGQKLELIEAGDDLFAGRAFRTPYVDQSLQALREGVSFRHAINYAVAVGSPGSLLRLPSRPWVSNPSCGS